MYRTVVLAALFLATARSANAQQEYACPSTELWPNAWLCDVYRLNAMGECTPFGTALIDGPYTPYIECHEFGCYPAAPSPPSPPTSAKAEPIPDDPANRREEAEVQVDDEVDFELQTASWSHIARRGYRGKKHSKTDFPFPHQGMQHVIAQRLYRAELYKSDGTTSLGIIIPVELFDLAAKYGNGMQSRFAYFGVEVHRPAEAAGFEQPEPLKAVASKNPDLPFIFTIEHNNHRYLLILAE